MEVGADATGADAGGGCTGEGVSGEDVASALSLVGDTATFLSDARGKRIVNGVREGIWIDSIGGAGAAGPLERVCGAIRTGEGLGADADVGTGGDGGRSWTRPDAEALARVCVVGMMDAESERDEAVEARFWSKDNRGGNTICDSRLSSVQSFSRLQCSLNIDHYVWRSDSNDFCSSGYQTSLISAADYPTF